MENKTLINFYINKFLDGCYSTMVTTGFSNRNRGRTINKRINNFKMICNQLSKEDRENVLYKFYPQYEIEFKKSNKSFKVKPEDIINKLKEIEDDRKSKS